MADGKTQTSSSLNLYQKLAAITGDIGAIAKDGRNNEQNFDFISYAAVSGRLRELFAKYGVVIVPRMQQTKRQQRTEVLTKNGRKGIAVLIDMSFNVLNADKPEEKFTVQWTGEAIDYGDKATNKAATSALKYYLMRQFNISEKGDDPDADSPDRGDTSTPPRAPSPVQQLHASEKQLDTIKNLASVKGKSQEWLTAILAKFEVGTESKAAQGVIDSLTDLEDRQDLPAAQAPSTQPATDEVMDIMTEGDNATDEQVEQFKELRVRLGYSAGSTTAKLKLVSSGRELDGLIRKMRGELADQIGSSNDKEKEDSL